MAKRGLSPNLTIKITPERWEKAKEANSAACLIADAARDSYPELSLWRADMATISATDVKKGVRFHWLTPPPAQDLLLAFDQRWAQPSHHVITLRRAFRITTIRRGGRWKSPDERAARLADLEAKEKKGTLTASERGALTRMRRNPNPNPPATDTTTTVTRDGTAIGGRAPGARNRKNPNLLGGLTRVYGAHRARPAQAYRDAVEAEVQARLDELSEAKRKEEE